MIGIAAAVLVVVINEIGIETGTVQPTPTESAIQTYAYVHPSVVITGVAVFLFAAGVAFVSRRLDS